MGLFDIFKKKQEPVKNNPNSVFTLRFTIPYFQIFDKTDKALSALPIKMAVTGSCQYRISEPDLRFDNVPLSEMSPAQLEAHVKDALAMNIKTYFNSITTIPLLQFESMIAQISDAAKIRMTQILNEEFGINLRAFSISGVRYDTEDPNYLRLQTVSQRVVENRTKKADAISETEIGQIKLDNELTAKRKQKDFDFEQNARESERELEMRKRKNDLEFEQNSRVAEHDMEMQKRKKKINAADNISDIFDADSSLDL